MDLTYSPREVIYRQLRAALLFKGPLKMPELKPRNESTTDQTDAIALFAKVFTENGGTFYLAHNKFDAMDAVLRLMENNKWNNVFTSSPFWQQEFKEIDKDESLKNQFNDQSDLILSQADFAYAFQGLLGFDMQHCAWDKSLNARKKPVIWLIKANTISTNLGDLLQRSKHRYGKRYPSGISLWRPDKSNTNFSMALVLNQTAEI